MNKTILPLILPFVLACAGASAPPNKATYVFFSSRPATVPDGLVVLKVRVVGRITDASEFVDVAILESAGGVRGVNRLRVRIDRPSSICSDCDETSRGLGAIDGPAYIFGFYEQTDARPVYFHALRLPGNLSPPNWRKGRKLEDYIVDPAYKPKLVKR